MCPSKRHRGDTESGLYHKLCRTAAKSGKQAAACPPHAHTFLARSRCAQFTIFIRPPPQAGPWEAGNCLIGAVRMGPLAPAAAVLVGAPSVTATERVHRHFGLCQLVSLKTGQKSPILARKPIQGTADFGSNVSSSLMQGSSGSLTQHNTCLFSVFCCVVKRRHLCLPPTGADFTISLNRIYHNW